MPCVAWYCHMLYWVRRSEGSPTVCFQRYATSIVSPSTQHPPGNLTNAGFNPSSIPAKSRRSPLGRFFHVSLGNRETISREKAPSLVVETTKRARGSDSAAFNEK